MRLEHDAVMVGVQTVVGDDPLLTVRLDEITHRSPLRVVIDRMRTSAEARMFTPERDCGRIVVLASGKANTRPSSALP